MAYGDYYGFPPYVPVAERRRRAAKKLAQLRKQGREPAPVAIAGREIATTFWGKAWCDHLEAHADLASRLPRGKTYVRNGSVIDLRISEGEVRALVSGTEILRREGEDSAARAGALEDRARRLRRPDRAGGRAPDGQALDGGDGAALPPAEGPLPRRRASSTCPAPAPTAPGSASTSRRLSTAWARASTTRPSCSSRSAASTAPSWSPPRGRRERSRPAAPADGAIGGEHLAEIFGIELEAPAPAATAKAAKRPRGAAKKPKRRRSRAVAGRGVPKRPPGASRARAARG